MRASSVAPEIFFLRHGSGANLQAQLRERVVAAILTGQIRPGDRLPSTRRLADYLHISRTTVTLAYQELGAQGYLEAAARSAHRVADRGRPLGPAGAATAAEGAGVDWHARLRRAGHLHRPIVKPFDWQRYPYPFLYGQMDMSLFDLAEWRECSRMALARRDFEEMASDAAAADDPMLVDHIRSHGLPLRGIEAKPEEVLVTLGAQNALWIATALLLGPERRAAHENPGHPDIAGALHLSGAAVSAVDVDAEGLPPASLPARLDVLVVTPSHQAPTTVTMPLQRRRQLLEAADARDFVIVEDDYEFEMSFLAPPSPALKSLDRRGRVIYVGSFSKSLFPGLRLGYLVGPAPLIAEARAMRALMLRHPPGHLQRTVAHFLARGSYDALIRRMRDAFHERYTTMIEALDRTGLKIAGSSRFGGTSLWLEGPPGLDATALAQELREDGVLIESGAPFFAGPAAPCRFFRLGFSSIPPARIPEGITRLAHRVEAHARSGRVRCGTPRS